MKDLCGVSSTNNQLIFLVLTLGTRLTDMGTSRKRERVALASFLIISGAAQTPQTHSLIRTHAQKRQLCCASFSKNDDRLRHRQTDTITFFVLLVGLTTQNHLTTSTPPLPRHHFLPSFRCAWFCGNHITHVLSKHARKRTAPHMSLAGCNHTWHGHAHTKVIRLKVFGAHTSASTKTNVPKIVRICVHKTSSVVAVTHPSRALPYEKDSHA